MGYQERTKLIRELRKAHKKADESLGKLRDSLEDIVAKVGELREDVTDSADSMEEDFPNRAEELKDKFSGFDEVDDEAPDLDDIESFLSEVSEALEKV